MSEKKYREWLGKINIKEYYRRSKKEEPICRLGEYEAVQVTYNTGFLEDSDLSLRLTKSEFPIYTPEYVAWLEERLREEIYWGHWDCHDGDCRGSGSGCPAQKKHRHLYERGDQ